MANCSPGHQGAAGEPGITMLEPWMVQNVEAAIEAFEQYVSVGAIRRRTGLETSNRGLAKAGDTGLDIWVEI